MTFQVFPWPIEPQQGTTDGWPKNKIGSLLLLYGIFKCLVDVVRILDTVCYVAF